MTDAGTVGEGKTEEPERVAVVALRILLADVQRDQDAYEFWTKALHAAGTDALLEAFARVTHDLAVVIEGLYGETAPDKLREILHHELGLTR